MGQVLHGCATTTEAIRRAIQNSQESLRALARRYGINQKIVAKWKERETVADLPTGPKEAKSTVLSIEEEAIIVAFRRHTLRRLAGLAHRSTGKAELLAPAAGRRLSADEKALRIHIRRRGLRGNGVDLATAPTGLVPPFLLLVSF